VCIMKHHHCFSSSDESRRDDMLCFRCPSHHLKKEDKEELWQELYFLKPKTLNTLRIFTSHGLV
jgi:hypothetical protein